MAKKQQILNSAILLFSEKGYDGVSTKEISEIAEVSEALIFKHFKSKENLFIQILTEALDKISRTLETYKSENPSLKVHLDSVFIEVAQNTKLWRFFHVNRIKMTELMSKEKLKESREHIINLIDSHVNDKVKSSYIVSAIDGIVGWYVLSNDKSNLKDSLEILYKSLDIK